MSHKVLLFGKRCISCPFLYVVCKLDAIESSKLDFVSHTPCLFIYYRKESMSVFLRMRTEFP